MSADRWRLEDRYRIQLMADSEVAGEEVIRLWTAEAHLAPDEARKRLTEVVHVATDPAGMVVGVSTSYLARNARLRMDLWHQRGFVSPAHRQSNIGMQFALRGIEHFSRAYAEGRDTRGAGMIQEIENEGIKLYFNRGTQAPTYMTFIGENDRGDHVRVVFFPGAMAPRLR